ncbi:MAG: D-glycerate dehydrogenase [Gammaproteobacteria bacterium]|nr:D-glycerate dehydrogenase [Gammaproteobacteria bacterium]MBA3732527.1 D-glycerate dehydrogenase [Gammaproteobacteria bacterium]
MAKPKVIVTRKWPQAVEKKLKSQFDVTLNESDEALTADQLADAMRNADAVCPTVTDKMTAEVLGTDNRRAKMIGNFGVGFNNIDVDAAKEHGLVVTNTPEVLTDATADLAMTLLLMTARRAGEGERHVRGGHWTGWRPTHMMGAQVTGKTLGLIGMGRIAQAVARRAHHGFGMKIIFHDPYPPKPGALEGLDAESRDSVEDVLGAADFVSIHCPGGAATQHLLNAERFKLMQDHAFLINSARGDVVDEKALIEALQSGTIAGAGLDVFEQEPKVSAALLKMENVVALPHLGSATTETRVAMGERVLSNLEAFFADREPPDRVA